MRSPSGEYVIFLRRSLDFSYNFHTFAKDNGYAMIHEVIIAS